MKDTTKKFFILGVLVIAITALMALKNLKTHQQAAGLADNSVIGQGKPVLLELGSHGCIPCKKMTPILAELGNEQTAFVVSFVDVKADESKSEQYGIELIPTQIFFDKDGKELFRHVGFYPKEDILAKWKEFGI